MPKKKKPSFDPRTFLSKITGGNTVSNYPRNQVVYSQGEPADSVFYIHKGKAKITVLSKQGKEAVVALLGPVNSLARDVWRHSRVAWRQHPP